MPVRTLKSLGILLSTVLSLLIMTQYLAAGSVAPPLGAGIEVRKDLIKKKGDDGSPPRVGERRTISMMEESICGDCQCKGEETYDNCPADCLNPNPPAPCCGDHVCSVDQGETVLSCMIDCCAPHGGNPPRPVANSCGNGICECWENGGHCEQDCPISSCGNGRCEKLEIGSCTTDCGDCPPPRPLCTPQTCGNGICELASDGQLCPDCLPRNFEPIPPSCGNGICEPGRDSWYCRDCLAVRTPLCYSRFVVEKGNFKPRDMAVKEDRIYVVGELDSPLEGAEDPCANIWIGAYETCKGRLVWERTFNPGSCENTVRGMALNPNSGTIYVTGFYMEEDGDYRDNNKVFVRKFRGDGTPDRFGRNVQLVYPETEEYFKSYKALDIAIGSDGGILVAGQYRDDFYGRNVWVAKADSSGSWRWTERSSRYLKTGIIYGIAVDESNNPVVAGATWENVFAPLIRPSIWMGKLQASNGELLSEYIQPPARDTDYHIHSIGDPDHYDYSGSAIAVHDSLIALVGFRPLSSGSDYSDYKASWIGLFENSPTEPEMLWNDTHMPVKGDESCAEDVVFSSSGDMFVVGNVGPYADADADNKIWIKKYAPASGREVPTWEKRFDNLSSRRVMSVAVGTDDEGQVYILGDTGFFQRMCGDNTSLPYAYTTRTYHSDDKAIIIKSPSE